MTQKLDCKTDEWRERFKIKTSTKKLTFISFGKLSTSVSCKVFNRRHSSFSAASAKFLTTQLSNSFRGFFLGRLLACLAELNASYSQWEAFNSAACFSLKSSTRAEYFSFCFGPEFWKSLPARPGLTTANFDHARESRRVVTSFVHLSSNRWQASPNHSASSISVIVWKGIHHESSIEIR